MAPRILVEYPAEGLGNAFVLFLFIKLYFLTLRLLFKIYIHMFSHTILEILPSH